jgi:hypothetical protein
VRCGCPWFSSGNLGSASVAAAGINWFSLGLFHSLADSISAPVRTLVGRRVEALPNLFAVENTEDPEGERPCFCCQLLDRDPVKVRQLMLERARPHFGSLLFKDFHIVG